jgi:hypothetical protein
LIKIKAASDSATTRSGPAGTRPAPQSDTPSADTHAVETSQLNAKIKTICRGY